MRDLFYFLLSIILIGWLAFAWINDPVSVFPNDLKGIVIDKQEHTVLGDIVTVQTNEDSKRFVCYDILYDNVSVGDTIWYGAVHPKK